MTDTFYFRQRAEQSLDQAARTPEPARSIHLELARRYTEASEDVLRPQIVTVR